MRLWSLHPRYLDVRGLTAVWREGLLAQAVLRGETVGYRNHPQLERFKAQEDPRAAIATYLSAVLDEARRRGYAFDERKIGEGRIGHRIPVKRGQVDAEWEWLRERLAVRAPKWLEGLKDVSEPEAHPSFEVVEGGVEDWERGIPTNIEPCAFPHFPDKATKNGGR